MMQLAWSIVEYWSEVNVFPGAGCGNSRDLTCVTDHRDNQDGNQRVTNVAVVRVGDEARLRESAIEITNNQGIFPSVRKQ
jgi:hypothetical protein